VTPVTRRAWVRPARAILALAALAVAAGRSDRPSRAFGPPERTVAIGDVHGDARAFEAILMRAGLVDARLEWQGGAATLVQIGDVTDRGRDVRRVLDLLMRLERDAPARGGRVVFVLGNHEVMNLLGETRDVTPEIFASFADERSEARRQAAWEAAAALETRRTATSQASGERLGRDAWMAAHPPGFLEYRDAFGPRGRYGRWLRQHGIVARVGQGIFMHAGMDPERPVADLEGLNRQVRAEIARFDRYVARLVEGGLALPFSTLQEILAASAAELERAASVLAAARAEGREPDLSAFDVDLLAEARQILQVGTWALLDPQGPLWFRGYATAPDDEGSRRTVGALLDRLGAQYLVLGHTPAADGRIRARFGGRVFLIDTGMLASVYPGGRPSALEIDGRSVTAVYLDGRVPLGRRGDAPPGLLPAVGVR
jgi:hypothetical protein